MTRVRALSVASEIYPLVKTGGLADVAGALPKALAEHDIVTRTLVPGYPQVMAALRSVKDIVRYDDFYGGRATLRAGRGGGHDLIVLDAPHLFNRPGNPYQGPDGTDWSDNAIRFAAFGKAAALIGQGAWPDFVPHVVHAHDWQAGLAAAFMHYAGGPRPGTIATIHNLAFQGQFPAALLEKLGLPIDAFGIDGVEYYGAIGFLKAALQLSDRITTVSPTYALEIQGEEDGMGLDGLLRLRGDALSGILNGIDTTIWNPETDRHIASPYNSRMLGRRAANKQALQARLGLRIASDAFVIGVISRKSWQKGLDLLLDNLGLMLSENMQLAVLGAGEVSLQDRYIAAAEAHPTEVGVVVGYHEKIAHLIQAGADVIAVPSRFEPCGLTQLCALRYGAIPIVSRVGGLADTVIDANEAAQAAGVATGFQFAPPTREALGFALKKARAMFRDHHAWRRLQRNAMSFDVSWRQPSARYAALYRAVARKSTP